MHSYIHSVEEKRSEAERLEKQSIRSMLKAAQDEIVRQHHRLNGHEFEQTPGESDGQGSLAWCSPWGFKELDMT